MNVLLFTGASDWGGAEIVLGHLLAELGEHVRPALLGVDREVLARVAGCRPGTPQTLVPPIRSKRDLAAIRAHRRAIAAAAPDIVQLNLPVPFAEPYSVLAALTVPRTKVIVVEHLPMAIPSRGIRLLKRVTAPRLDAHVAVGSSAAREVEALCRLRPGSVQVVPNGVPVPAAGSGNGSIRPAGAGFVIGALGRLHRQKGFDVLVRALARLPESHLVLVGDGPERGALERLAAELGVADRLTITGWDDRATGYLPSFDAVALPSRFEGLPLVLLEAMLHGRAVVATSAGSIRDAVQDGVTGLLVPVDDDRALASALARLRDEPALRNRLGAAAVDLARQRFTAPAMARGYEQLYSELIAR